MARALDRSRRLPDRLSAESLCHWDVRDDNVLIQPEGTVVIVDWGMACLGPRWADLVFLALSWAGSAQFDDRIHRITPRPDDEDVTDLLLLFGMSQAWMALQPAPPGLANLPAFCRREAVRILEGARRRLGGATASQRPGWTGR